MMITCAYLFYCAATTFIPTHLWHLLESNSHGQGNVSSLYFYPVGVQRSSSSFFPSTISLHPVAVVQVACNLLMRVSTILRIFMSMPLSSSLSGMTKQKHLKALMECQKGEFGPVWSLPRSFSICFTAVVGRFGSLEHLQEFEIILFASLLILAVVTFHQAIRPCSLSSLIRK